MADTDLSENKPLREALSDWQLIETFPPNLHSALLWGRQWDGGPTPHVNDPENYTSLAHWEEPRVHWMLYQYADEKTPTGLRFITETYYNGDEALACWATHWMPLPEPPQ